MTGKLMTIKAGAVSSLLLAGSLAVHAQSCALCYSQAASEKARFIQGLRDGITILIWPSLLVSTVMILVAYRKRNLFNDSQGPDQEAW